MTDWHSWSNRSCMDRNAVLRSNPSVPMATFHPLFTPPTTRSAVVRASSKKTSLNSAEPVSCFSGLTSMPGWCIGTNRNERPLCLGASGSVRQTAKIQWAWWASVVQTFCPVTTHSSPSRTARVFTLARSEPASGSLKPWHHSSSARRIPGRKRCFCSSDPKAISVGPSRPSPKKLLRAGALARAYPSLKIPRSTIVAPRPPYSFGQPSPIQPASPSSFSQARPTSHPRSSAGPPPPPRAAYSPRRCSPSQVRTSSRKPSSASLNPKSTGSRCTRPVDTMRKLHYEDSQVEITKLVVGPMDNNVFVVRSRRTGDAVMLDAANEHEKLLELCRSLNVRKVLETHGHWDHIQAVPA